MKIGEIQVLEVYLAILAFDSFCCFQHRFKNVGTYMQLLGHPRAHSHQSGLKSLVPVPFSLDWSP